MTAEDAKTVDGVATPDPEDVPRVRVGAVVSPAPFQPVIRYPAIDSRSAAAEALAAFLECAVFEVWGKKAASRPFNLRSVSRQWPDAKKPLETPCASIVDLGPVSQAAWSLVPFELVETIDVFEPGSVLWKTAEAVPTFQVDFWCSSEPEREAVAARLPALFSPGEDQGGILVQGPETYFGRVVRLTLDSSERMDSGFSAYPNEWRLMTRIRAEIDEVHLRCARLATFRVSIPEIGEDIDISGPEEGPCDV